MIRSRLAIALIGAAVLSSITACGNGGDDDYPAQVLFTVTGTAGTGRTTFAVQQLSSARTIHQLPGRTFTVDASSVTFLLANAHPPYEGIFTRVAEASDAGAVAEVDAVTIQATESETVELSAEQPTATVRLLPNAGTLATERSGTDLRFELCSPVEDVPDCRSTFANLSGISGRPFSGTIGDIRFSFIIDPLDVTQSNQAITTPAVLFMEKPEETVSGIFRGAKDEELRAEMYINDRPIEDGVSTNSDIVLKEDL